jgi:S1-C subfamily serine protease
VNRDFLFEDERELVTHVVEFFFASVLSKEHFDKVVAICLANPEPTSTNRHIFIRKGQFSLKDFLHYWMTLNPKGGLLKNIVIEELLRRFSRCHLLNRSDLLASYGLDYYQVNEGLARFFLERDALENLAFDFSYLVAKYSGSILRLVVTDKHGDIWNGTGFLFVSNQTVVTNRHVVDGDANQKPRVLTAAGRELPVKTIYSDSEDDLALVLLEGPFDARPLFPVAKADPLDEIVTLGYPRIPLAKTSPLVAHKGEINGSITLPHGERLLFSAKTAPGNSGGPLLNRAGLVVGIVAEDLQSDWARTNNVQPYFAAIPSVKVASLAKEWSRSTSESSAPGQSGIQGTQG